MSGSSSLSVHLVEDYKPSVAMAYGTCRHLFTERTATLVSNCDSGCGEKFPPLSVTRGGSGGKGERCSITKIRVLYVKCPEVSLLEKKLSHFLFIEPHLHVFCFIFELI